MNDIDRSVEELARLLCCCINGDRSDDLMVFTEKTYQCVIPHDIANVVPKEEMLNKAWLFFIPVAKKLIDHGYSCKGAAVSVG
jgi:hypothetical protein